MSLEAACVAIGTAVVRSAIGLWLKDHAPLAAGADKVVDVVAGRLSGIRESNRFRRNAEATAEEVAARLEPLIRGEFRDLAEHERTAAVAAVADALALANLSDAELLAADLDAGRLERHVRAATPRLLPAAALSPGAEGLFNLVLREACRLVLQVRSALPGAGMAGLAEVLRRETELTELVTEALTRLPHRRDEADFVRDYRQLIGNRLDQVELFGATLSDTSRRYPLSVAYLSLNVSTEGGSRLVRVPEALCRRRRIFVRGEAGLGKTMLLQWVAVHAARGRFGEPLTDWNELIPFFLPLRRYAGTTLPAADRFLDEIGRHLAADMPSGWVQQQLRAGRAAILVDGVDELPGPRRDDVRRWLAELVDSFPEAAYIVTSRPAAAPSDWLDREGFFVCDLEPMTLPDVREFVDRWHRAMAPPGMDEAAAEELRRYRDGLTQQLESRNHLRRLAGYPLLCALLCALHRDRRANLPDDRMELYDVALEMLLQRRDAERNLPMIPGATRTAKTILLQDVAYWLIRNGWTEADTGRVIARIAAKLVSMPQVQAGPAEIYQSLLERTGLLREPVHLRVGFIHRTFQEYLAAKAATEADDIGVLVDNAEKADWREVIVLAVGHAGALRRAELITGLLDRAEAAQPDRRNALWLLAFACLETASELPVGLRSRVAAATADLLPPKSADAARALAAGGSTAIDLLARTEIVTADEARATIRTLAEIGDPEGLSLIARIARAHHAAVMSEVVSAADAFNLDDYATAVLSRLEAESLHLTSRHQVAVAKRFANVETLRLGFPIDSNPIGREQVKRLAAPAGPEKPGEGRHSDWSVVTAGSVFPELRPPLRAGTVRTVTGLTADRVTVGPAGAAGLARPAGGAPPRILELVDVANLNDVVLPGHWEGRIGQVALVGCDAVDLADWLRRTGCTRLELIFYEPDLSAPADDLASAVLRRLRPMLTAGALHIATGLTEHGGRIERLTVGPAGVIEMKRLTDEPPKVLELVDIPNLNDVVLPAPWVGKISQVALVGCDAVDLAAWLRLTGCIRLELADCELNPAILPGVPNVLALRIGQDLIPVSTLTPLLRSKQSWRLAVTSPDASAPARYRLY